MLKKTSNRRGAAIVEVAVCLPIIFLIIIGSVELSAGLFHQYTARLTAHQCAVVAAQGSKTADDVQVLANQIFSQRGFNEFSIEINEVARTVNNGSVEPATTTQFLIPSSGATTEGLDEVPRGTVMRLSVSASRPRIGGLGFTSQFLNSTIVADCVFVKEL